jgi:hypothetical protein
MQEKWKDIPEYEGYYQISNLGRVKSLSRNRKGNKGSLVLVKEAILKYSIDKYGYPRQALSKDGKLKHIPIHRLVAICFTENKNSNIYIQINHIDGNKLNNTPENLEWCDAKYNTQEAIRLGLRCIGKGYKPRIDSKRIYQYKGDILIKIYPCLAEAIRATSHSKSAISNCLSGISKTSGGFIWLYEEKQTR